jgi:hypothetical protein
MNLATILLLTTLTASAQVTLTPMQVRTVHAIMDNEQRLREQAAIDSAQLADYTTALRQSETLRINAEANLADTDKLRRLAVNRADKLEQSLVGQARRTRARSVVAWVLGGIVAVETVVIVVVTR